MNVSYEGIRCQTNERKVYAYGRANNEAWAPAKMGKWVDMKISNRIMRNARSSDIFSVLSGLK